MYYFSSFHGELSVHLFYTCVLADTVDTLHCPLHCHPVDTECKYLHQNQAGHQIIRHTDKQKNQLLANP